MPIQNGKKRAWLLLTASITLHIFLLTSTRIVHDHAGSHPITSSPNLIRRFIADPEPIGHTSLLALPYSEWYESLPPAFKPFFILILLFILAFLFSFIGISASDFFCPNLSTIASYLGLNESTAGVTFLAFGNGSPDVFSTFSAMKGGTFGLAIGELIGAASFIVSIVVGSIALIRPFHVPRHAFLRDVLFFTSAVIVLILVLHDGHLTLWESGGMVVLYITYVGVVVGGNWWGRRRRRKAHSHDSHTLKAPIEIIDNGHISPLLTPTVPQPGGQLTLPDLDEANGNEFSHTESPGTLTPTLHRPHLSRARSHSSASHLGSLPAHFHHHDSIDTPRATFSLLGAVEFRDVVNSLRKESNSRGNSPARTPNPGGVDRDRETDYFGPISASTYGHRRSSSYGFHSVGRKGGSTAKGTPMVNGRRRASTHSLKPSERTDSYRSVSSPPPQNVTVPEPNPWEDQRGHPPTPSPQLSSLSTSTTRPNRPKVVIPNKAQPVRQYVPSISVVDPSGHVEEPGPDEQSPLLATPPNGRSESRFRIRRRTKHVLRTLFPSLQSFRHKSIIGMILAIMSVPAILALTLTLPVVDDGRPEEGAVALPIADDEGLNEDGSYVGDEDGEDSLETEVERDDYDDEADRLLQPEMGEELHHLVDHGFSPLHSPLGRISHSALRRMNHHVEEGEVGGDGEENGDEEDEELNKELYEEMEQERGLEFNKYLTAAQCVLGPVFCAFIIFSDMSYLPWVILGVGSAGVIAAVAVLYYATDGSSKFWRLVRCMCGFTCSMVWIAAIADEVVGVLDTVGEILGLSDAIIGLTIFAVGNSLADLVANVTVAQFAPAMAYAACFGGPMLNLLLGIGGSGTYHIATTPQHPPVFVDFSPTLWVSAGGLVVMLIATAIFVPMNGYLIDRRWAACLIAAYVVLMCVNVGVEVKTGRA
ncbi:hypothetical protein CI109_105052 [Kwoniella shandongensis]|uniref:Uncharacterized protein n=1 Tax=Kwoniella shandongensis TaxID=1734106 RepID=A0A5M6BWM9_9TREE|nr:uncharacterized protein CI109_004348 [Kwoniella shandongensis]KAA5527288.1 hypothetical protein CI109_004348 [Kwoniella shandongensis]